MPEKSSSTSTQRSAEQPSVGSTNPTTNTPTTPSNTEQMNHDNAKSGIMDQAKQSVSQVASQAGDKVTSRINQQKERTAEGLTSLVQAVRQVADQLKEKDQNAAIPQYLNSAVERVERLSDYVRSTDVRQMVNQVEQFARRQPAIFLGSAFAIGLIGARFIKSSGQQTGSQQSQALMSVNTTQGQTLNRNSAPSVQTGSTIPEVPPFNPTSGNKEGS